MRFPIRLHILSWLVPALSASLVGLVAFPADGEPAPLASEAKLSRGKSVAASTLDNKEKRTPEFDLSKVGSVSIGNPSNGRLLNGVCPTDGNLFEVVEPDFAWGTQETIDYLEVAVREVHKRHPGVEPLHVGHISKPTGGYLSPHLSHQSGRDVDLGFYYKSKRAWYRRGTNDTFDAERTWTLVKALVTMTDVEMILLDGGLQVLLRNQAERLGEDKVWLHKVFRGTPERPAIIRHVAGHATHLHVRFFSPEAESIAQRVYPQLLEDELVEPVVVYLHHKVRKGETLGRIAKQYGTTVPAIQQANGLRGTVIQAKKTYKIPKTGGPAQHSGQPKFFQRVLP